ncbi:hypothetical protein [Heyndrickxia coagulans]|uniref:hypothetical protein n=1 Tax=Heyndrickxia coagulans TaxID=1398 RepID=UPI002E1BD945|nr:hypothetical protein [Heyndrickxia coagulans]
MTKLTLMKNYDLNDLPQGMFIVDMEIILDENAIDFLNKWLLNFPKLDIFILEPMSGIREELELKIKHENLVCFFKIGYKERYVILLTDINDFIKIFKIAIFEINQGYNAYVFINKGNNVVSYDEDLNKLFQKYEYTLIFSEVGITFMSHDKKLTTMDDIIRTLPEDTIVE